MRLDVEKEIAEVEAIRSVLEKAETEGRTHMGIAKDLIKAGFRMVKVNE